MFLVTSGHIEAKTAMKTLSQENVRKVRPTTTSGLQDKERPGANKKVKLVSDTQSDMLANKQAQFAFENSMIRETLQFTLRIAFCCVLHRCTSLEIHR